MIRIQSTKQENIKTSKNIIVSVHPEWRKHIVPNLVFGGFSRDCYGSTDEETSKLLIKTFDDYGEALEFAQNIADKTAIHLTKNHKGHQFECTERLRQ